MVATYAVRKGSSRFSCQGLQGRGLEFNVEAAGESSWQLHNAIANTVLQTLDKADTD